MEFRIFDAHSHVPPRIPYTPHGNYDIEDSRAYRLRIMDQAGVRAAMLMASNNYERPNGVADTRRMNDFVAWYRDQVTDRFPVAIGTVEPLHGEAAGLEEIRRIDSELHLSGLVWHHMFAGCSIDDPRMVAFAQEMARLGMVGFVHLNGESMYETPARLESLARKVPDITLVGLSSLLSAQSVFEMQGVMERCPNVLIDTSFARPIGQVVDTFADRFGAERLLFGTDLVPHPDKIYHVLPGLAEILESDRLSDEDKADILWNNAERLFPALQHVR